MSILKIHGKWNEKTYVRVDVWPISEAVGQDIHVLYWSSCVQFPVMAQTIPATHMEHTPVPDFRPPMLWGHLQGEWVDESSLSIPPSNT